MVLEPLQVEQKSKQLELPAAVEQRKRNLYDPHEPHSAIEKKPDVNFLQVQENLHD